MVWAMQIFTTIYSRYLPYEMFVPEPDLDCIYAGEYNCPIIDIILATGIDTYVTTEIRTIVTFYKLIEELWAEEWESHDIVTVLEDTGTPNVLRTRMIITTPLPLNEWRLLGSTLLARFTRWEVYYPPPERPGAPYHPIYMPADKSIEVLASLTKKMERKTF